MQASRTKLVVDSLGNDVGHVTSKYTLVRNPEVRAAVELLGEAEGLKLQGWKSEYRRGRTCLVWKDASNPIKVTGDSSMVWPMVKLTNSYTGSHTLEADLVLCRHICENALIWGQMFAIDLSQKHIGEINLTEIFQPALAKLGDQVAVAQLQMEVLQQTPLEFNHPVWQEVKESTAERYHERLGRSVRENARELGRTTYAALQAISEVGTHEMKGWGGIGWTEDQTKRILAVDEVAAALAELQVDSM
jgi:hypothetical protein